MYAFQVERLLTNQVKLSTLDLIYLEFYPSVLLESITELSCLVLGSCTSSSYYKCKIGTHVIHLTYLKIQRELCSEALVLRHT